MSVPAAKARPPAPVMMSAFTGPGTVRLAQISPSRSYMAKVRALWAAGRLKAIVPTSPSTLYSSSSPELALIVRSLLMHPVHLAAGRWRRRGLAWGHGSAMQWQLTANVITATMVASIAPRKGHRRRLMARFLSVFIQARTKSIVG